MAVELYTLAEIADLLRVSDSIIYRLCERSELPHYRFGRLYRFNPREVLGYLGNGNMLLNGFADKQNAGMDVAGLARCLRLSESWTRKLLRLHKVSYHKLGPKRIYDLDAVLSCFHVLPNNYSPAYKPILPPYNTLCTLEQLASHLLVSRQLIYKLIKEGLPHYRVHSLYRFDLAEVLDYLASPQANPYEQSRENADYLSPADVLTCLDIPCVLWRGKIRVYAQDLRHWREKYAAKTD